MKGLVLIEVIEEGEEFVQEQKKSIILNRTTVLFILFGFLLEAFGKSVGMANIKKKGIVMYSIKSTSCMELLNDLKNQ